jgi:Zn-dependent protease with chaperone function
MKDFLEALAFFLDKSSNMKKWFFILTIILLFIFWLTSFYLAIINENINDLIVNIGSYSFLSLFFILILYILWFWTKEKLKEWDLKAILEDLQNKFSNLEKIKITSLKSDWKRVFQINEETQILASIDKETQTIRNFYLYLWEEKRKKVLENVKIKNYKIDDDFKFYNSKNDLVFKETLEKCEIWEYEKAIKFLLKIL